jgi:hypothetical protein
MPMNAMPRHATTAPVQPTPAAALAAPCLDCGTTGGRVEGRCTRPWRRQGYCDRCYTYKRQHGLIATGPDHPEPLPAIVTPAMLGYRPGQPPTDPDCTPGRVRDIANTNARRALQWLATHTDLGTQQARDLAVWEPARAAQSDATREAA